MILYTFMLFLSSANAKKGGGDAAETTDAASTPASTAVEADVPSDGNSRVRKSLVGSITSFIKSLTILPYPPIFDWTMHG